MGLERAALAVIRNDVAVVLSVENVVQLDDVRVVELLEDADLILQQLIVAFRHLRQLDHFDGVRYFLVIVLAAAEDLAAVPAPDAIV